MALELLPLSYIDPGTGSILLQGLLAGVFAVGFAIKSGFLRLFGGKRDENENEDEKPESGSES